MTTEFTLVILESLRSSAVFKQHDASILPHPAPNVPLEGEQKHTTPPILHLPERELQAVDSPHVNHLRPEFEQPQQLPSPYRFTHQ